MARDLQVFMQICANFAIKMSPSRGHKGSIRPAPALLPFTVSKYLHGHSLHKFSKLSKNADMTRLDHFKVFLAKKIIVPTQEKRQILALKNVLVGL